MRVDLYGPIHKAQRFHLSNLLIRLGRTDVSDEPSMELLGIELRRLLDHLRDHAVNEEKYIHPLFARLGGAAALEREHLELETGLTGLEATLSSRNWERLYGRVARFAGDYFVHLDEEETAQRTTLWPNYRDEELFAVFQRFKAERSPALAAADREFMVPALSPSENGQLLGTAGTGADF